MKLQANQAGSWRNVADFDADRRDAVLQALPALARAIGEGCRWCIVDEAGKREWLGSLADAVAATPRDMRA